MHGSQGFMIPSPRAQLEHSSTGVTNMLCNQITFSDPCCYYKLLYWTVTI